MYFAHEKFDCYRLALEVARWVEGIHVPSGRKHLREQMLPAADSMVLNIAEGLAKDGATRRHQLTTALGSAAEVSANLDLLGVEDAEMRDKLRRVGAMLSKLSRR